VDVIVAMTRGSLFPAAFAAFLAGSEFSRDLLKDSFNCPDRVRHGYRPPYSSVVNGEKTRLSRLPFAARAATSAATNFP
jgi:hypothetical protein